VFAAGGEEDGLVAQTQQRQRNDRRHHQDGVDQADITGGGDRPAVPG
jgi:hypothetical protein